MEYYNLIHDKNQIELYFDLIKQESCDSHTQNNEVNFLSVVARNKYLSGEEREKYHIGNSESMLQRIVCRDTGNFDSYFRHLLRFCVPLGSYTTNGLNIPQLALAIYGSYNPCSMVNNLESFMAKSLRILSSHKENPSQLRNLDIKFVSELYNKKSRKRWIDIDFDINKDSELHILEKYFDFCNENDIDYVTIETRGGFHVLMNKETIKCNFHKEVVELDGMLSGEGEVVINPNNILPVPGTLQGNFPVKFYLGEDLSEQEYENLINAKLVKEIKF